MRTPSLQPLAAGVAALLLVASMGWWVLSTPELVDPGQPTWKGADIVRMKAAMPEIAQFDHFYVNNENPFVPFHLRRIEEGVYNPKGPRNTQAPPPPPPIVKMLPPRQPVIVKEPAPTPLILPKIPHPPTNAPIVYGLLRNGDEEVVIVRMPGDKEPVNLKVGEKIKNRSLISIDTGNLATFLDPQGVEQRFSIGEGDLAVAQSGDDGVAPGKGPAGDKTNGGRGMVPKAPGTGGPMVRPPGVGVDGAIPRPAPREERKRREAQPEDKGKPTPPQQPPPKK